MRLQGSTGCVAAHLAGLVVVACFATLVAATNDPSVRPLLAGAAAALWLMVPAVIVLAVRTTVSFDQTGITYRNLVRSGRIPLEDVAVVQVAERWWTYVGDANISAGWHMSSPVLKVQVRGVRGGRTLTASAPFHLERQGRERVTSWCSEHSIPMA